ncbi:5'-nucleotidase C-terminal domain-containing protein [Umboniibacter marinipuniceus]|uniref:2',3'-cyclic-nucleotide 2'-phosphodiesterase/3'-nucleotidase n=1 Tax=Umboniibacter marinipuniceus TaxID=569599 RepID=A0A3M0A7I7_9GAMM|nr:5'-nucleotidase C-terminal domain-containing protein [Umboniibacter marinipuniceus]RMA80254.1 2',3'-cyclic-nucleotide 2'-phosphodiesterase/3'-nucleotidase [Umboniibacter marinipuniceus]
MLRIALFSLLFLSLHSIASAPVQLRIISTGDLNGQLLSYDYIADQETDEFGLARAATLIRMARSESDNSVTVDSGDLLKGSPMAAWAAQQTFTQANGGHPAYQALDHLDFNAAALGDSDFYYGLDYLMHSASLSNLPIVSANLYRRGINGQRGPHLLKPWYIESRQLRDIAGNIHRVNIGYIGFTDPNSLRQDNALQSRVETRSILASAREELPRLRAAGADVIIVLAHTSLSAVDSSLPTQRNVLESLAREPLVDAIIFNQTNGNFPNPALQTPYRVDAVHGKIFGTPAVATQRAGQQVGVIDLWLRKDRGSWTVGRSQVEIRSVQRPGRNVVEYKGLSLRLADAHRKTRHFANRPIGRTNQSLSSLLAQLQTDTATQLLHQVQLDYASKQLTLEDSTPLLSLVSPPLVGDNGNNPEAYTWIPTGVVTYRQAAGIFPRNGKLNIVRVPPALVVEVLECSAGQYLQLSRARDDAQPLLSKEFSPANFVDVSGMSYEIDLSKSPRYSNDCAAFSAHDHRIRVSPYDQALFSLDSILLVVEDSQLARIQQSFPNIEIDLIHRAGSSLQEQLIRTFEAANVAGVSIPLEQHWQFAAVPSFFQLNAGFATHSDPRFQHYIAANATLNARYLAVGPDGFGVYRLQFPSIEPNLPDTYVPSPELEFALPQIATTIETPIEEQRSRHIEEPASLQLDGVTVKATPLRFSPEEQIEVGRPETPEGG